MAKKGESTEDFWTDEQWVVLRPLPVGERAELVLRAIFAGRSLIAQAKHEGLTG